MERSLKDKNDSGEIVSCPKDANASLNRFVLMLREVATHPSGTHTFENCKPRSHKVMHTEESWATSEALCDTAIRRHPVRRLSSFSCKESVLSETLAAKVAQSTPMSAAAIASICEDLLIRFKR